MIWSPSKSAVVTFTLKRDLKPIAYCLAGQDLPQPASYKYLGVIFQSDCRWSEQADAVIKKARAASFRIARLIAFDRAPGPVAVLALVRSTLLPVITYALAFWRPNQLHFAKLQSLVVMPLRLALGLPLATAAVKVLAEYGLPSLQLLREFQLLAFGARCGCLQPPHPAAAIAADVASGAKWVPRRAWSFDRRRSWLVPAPPKTFPTLAKEIVDLRRAWRTKGRWLDPAFGDLSLLEQLRVQQRAAIPPFSEASDRRGLPAYFRTDPKPLASHRARLRFDVAKLNASMCRRHLALSAACATCPAESESPMHVLLQCPRFATERARFYAALAAYAGYARPSSPIARRTFVIAALLGRSADSGVAAVAGDCRAV
jgi:hypothetical protein